MFGFATMALIGAVFASPVQADYIYEANQDLYDLRDYSGTTNLAVGDDQVSAKFNFGLILLIMITPSHSQEWQPMVAYTLG